VSTTPRRISGRKTWLFWSTKVSSFSLFGGNNFSINHSGNIFRIIRSQFRRKKILWVSLVANRTDPSEDRPSSNGSCPLIGRCRVWTSMVHCMIYFYTSGPTTPHNTANNTGNRLYHRSDFRFPYINICRMKGCCQLSL